MYIAIATTHFPALNASIPLSFTFSAAFTVFLVHPKSQVKSAESQKLMLLDVVAGVL
jgi:hypothetical protein